MRTYVTKQWPNSWLCFVAFVYYAMSSPITIQKRIRIVWLKGIIHCYFWGTIKGMLLSLILFTITENNIIDCSLSSTLPSILSRKPTQAFYHNANFVQMLSHRFKSIFKISAGAILLIKINLTHWGRVMHICVSKLTIIGSHNGLSPGRRQATIWTNAEILWIEPLGTNFSEILIEILKFSFK